jgi:hypothetical protein
VSEKKKTPVGNAISAKQIVKEAALHPQKYELVNVFSA